MVGLRLGERGWLPCFVFGCVYGACFLVVLWKLLSTVLLAVLSMTLVNNCILCCAALSWAGPCFAVFVLVVLCCAMLAALCCAIVVLSYMLSGSSVRTVLACLSVREAWSIVRELTLSLW